ncbi:ribonuclease R [Prosthecobacter debontii]|uniref:Ribonuclease R n=1 Tax=Prosthecobacter debontii TaxID=48467 RepID=A0A1T4XC55_9BACT|nr:ribonuclease R [Prosthecobacter debontii]SKA86728.1 ribonuclease R [Prosthecobacter debontii]
MESKILKLLGQADYTPSNVPELIDLLKLKPSRQQELQAVLADLVEQGLIVRTKGNRYIQAREADLIPGVIQITRGGRGFVQPDEAGIGEISISESGTSTAMHGDRVLVRRNIRPTGLRNASPETNSGTVVRILQRKRQQFVGTLQRSRQFLYVIPDDPRISQNIMVPPPRDVGREAYPGDKVVVELTSWENRHTPPEGEVIEVLGAPDAEGVDMLSVLRHYALPLHFPKEVLAQAQTIAKSRPDNQPSAEECTDRVDCRSHNVITIDPDDARDFDDAICIQPAGGGKWKLWVHIADVSHYVRPGSPLDVEAKKRGNSTYLVDRVIPMLPEALSNELCSLKPGLDRLTKCVEFLLAKDGSVMNAKFYSAVIHSKRRFTYQEALRVIEGKAKNEIESMLHDAHHVAQLIRKARFDNGSLDLDFPENKIRLDDHGKVLRIERMENDVSHQLIEEYMLLANEAVASNLMKRNRPAVYRVHEAPKEKKLEEYRDDVLSHRIQCGDLTNRKEVQKLLARLSSLPIGAALKIGFLRSLMRARYAVEPLGHYGLAKTRYTHFTSPIRRYADLVVHRVLFDHADMPIPAMKQIAEHITDTEKNSADAERDSKEVKLYAYLEAQLESGDKVAYPALVTDTRNFGFFVDVQDLGLSGVVPLSSIQDDFYILEPVRNHLVGRHTRRVIKLGDRVTVQIYRIDRFKKQVDFELTRERPVRGEREDRPNKKKFDPRDGAKGESRSGKPGKKDVKVLASQDSARVEDEKPRHKSKGAQRPPQPNKTDSARVDAGEGKKKWYDHRPKSKGKTKAIPNARPEGAKKKKAKRS